MCACEPGFLCTRCASTPFDDGYQDDGREVSESEFESMSLARHCPEPMMFGGSDG